VLRPGAGTLHGSDAQGGFDSALTDSVAIIHHHLCCARMRGATQGLALAADRICAALDPLAAGRAWDMVKKCFRRNDGKPPFMRFLPEAWRIYHLTKPAGLLMIFAWQDRLPIGGPQPWAHKVQGAAQQSGHAEDARPDVAGRQSRAEQPAQTMPDHFPG
jgi:hypothetical protein